jgi:hypothetical protein
VAWSAINAAALDTNLAIPDADRASDHDTVARRFCTRAGPHTSTLEDDS